MLQETFEIQENFILFKNYSSFGRQQQINEAFI